MKHRKIISLTPIINKHSILRANGRLRNFSKIFFNNCPIILDSHHYVTRLLIKYYHKKFNHANFATVINEIRQKFGKLGLRNTLRSICSSV